MQSIETFDTERLVAERMQEKDFETLCEMHHDPRVMATLGGIRSDDETRRFLREKLDHWDACEFGFWMFRDKETGHFVGRGGLQHIEVGSNDEVEVGYSVLAKYWGQGLATEMARAMLVIAFEQLNLDNLVCFTLTTNQASQRVMEKAGFTFERNIVHAGQPHVLYRLQRDQYYAQRVEN